MQNKIDPSKLVLLPTAELKPNPKNRNKHPDEQIERLAEIIRYQGFRQPIIVSSRSGYIVAGHGRLLAAQRLGIERVPVVFQDFESEEQEYAFQVSDNAVAAWAELDLAGINVDLPDLGPDFDIELLGIKDFVLEPAELGDGGEASEPGSLSDRFLIPPFTVFNAREGWWQDRKRQWIAMGIQSELGRGGAAGSELQSAGTLGCIPPNQKQIMNRTGKMPPKFAHHNDPRVRKEKYDAQRQSKVSRPGHNEGRVEAQERERENEG